MLQTVYTRRSNTVAAQDHLRGRCSLPRFLGVHDYDVMRWFTGSEVERVTAESKWGLLRRLACDVEDANCALLCFASGVLGIAELNWVLPRGFPAPGDHRADLVGDRGALSTATLETGLRRSDETRAVLVDTATASVVAGHAGGMFYFELRHFVLLRPPARRAGGHARGRAGGAEDRAGRGAVGGRRRSFHRALSGPSGRSRACAASAAPAPRMTARCATPTTSGASAPAPTRAPGPAGWADRPPEGPRVLVGRQPPDPQSVATANPKVPRCLRI